MVLNVNAATVGSSGATEGTVSAEITAAAGAAAAALTAVLPMGADLDSIQFAAALNAAGATYLGTAGEHAAHRAMFAGSQELAATTYTATDAVHNAALGL